MAEQGYLAIADITGYTAYLNESELEHAQDSLSTLLNLLIDETKPPLTISRLEGDAVISFAIDGSFLQSQSIVDLIDATYCAFKQALERMVLNTTCTCNACRNIPNLDLKFFLHHGEFLLQGITRSWSDRTSTLSTGSPRTRSRTRLDLPPTPLTLGARSTLWGFPTLQTA